MSECVVRMEMPEGCWDCPCVNGEYGYCQADKEERQIEDPNERPSWCPILCSLPEGHGDLIDRDVLLQTFQNADYETYNDYCEAFDTTEAAETIVPAERSET